MRLLFLIPAIIMAGMIILSLLSQRGAPRGLVDGRLAPLPDKPNGVGSEAGTDDGKRVDPLRTDKPGLKAAVTKTGGTITSETDDYLSATYTSRLMRFVDDVEFRRDGDLWQVRSASRVGHSDMGANRKRVAAIRDAL
ncbi:DUF1499 domain-containing protein [uncultured Algimonas sp.]|uniref:DUF1499 domain-containing protein n=1 Tax=uncultured Algimonas sp. TaxID=1547920 RepID=UPI0026353FA4|nr:DUF1499 domain-containing protein [uncultured Algimonas sp.]